MAVKTFTTEVLTSADTNTYLANSGLVYVTGASFSAVTEILVDSVFTATYRNYRMIFDCQSSLGGGTFNWQMRAAGSTISTTTYNYSTLNIAAALATAGSTAGATSIRFGANDASGYNASTLDIFCPQIAQPTRLISAFNRNNGTIVENVWSANTNSTSYDGFRISTSTGTMTGTYVLAGVRSA